MTDNNLANAEPTSTQKTCFIIMPISDVDGYEVGHFKRVYDHIIKPACEDAGLQAIRADDVTNTNYIAIDILKRILNSDLAICDLSVRNPNVMYELGIRHAFDKPVVLMKDVKTSRIFDVQGLRTLDYSETLRIDSVQRDRAALATTIKATLAAGPEEVNSMIRLLNIQKADIGKPTQVSSDTSIILAALKDLAGRVTRAEDRIRPDGSSSRVLLPMRGLSRSQNSVGLPNGQELQVGRPVFDVRHQTPIPIGTLVDTTREGIIVDIGPRGTVELQVGDEQFEYLSGSPPKFI